MTPGIWYTVTKPSKRREFQIGDRIRLEDDGTISCPAAGGWMAAEDVAAATSGMDVAVDADRRAEKITKLRAELAALEATP
jgi:hypothetical protein